MKNLIKKLLGFFNLELRKGISLPLDVRQIRNTRRLSFLYSLIKDVKGNIVECGVGKGRTFLELSAICFLEQDGRKVWGFDSFQGFPEPTKEDESKRNPQKGEWNVLTPKMLEHILVSAGLPKNWLSEDVKVIKGFFQDSLKKYDGSPIAFLHIDADLYESYKECLRELYPLIVDRGIVLFDEYGEENWVGATKAVDEFLEKENKKLLEKDGKKYIIK